MILDSNCVAPLIRPHNWLLIDHMRNRFWTSQAAQRWLSSRFWPPHCSSVCRSARRERSSSQKWCWRPSVANGQWHSWMELYRRNCMETEKAVFSFHLANHWPNTSWILGHSLDLHVLGNPFMIHVTRGCIDNASKNDFGNKFRNAHFCSYCLCHEGSKDHSDLNWLRNDPCGTQWLVTVTYPALTYESIRIKKSLEAQDRNSN